MENQMVVAQDRQPQQHLKDYSSAADIIPELAACFALVRPVSMGDEAASEWLAVAANELAGYKTWALKDGLAHARKTCTHHGQIVPAVIKQMEESSPWRMGKPLDRLPSPKKTAPPPEIQGLIEGAAKALTSR